MFYYIFRGQNKNNAMIQYLLWRVLSGKHSSVTLNFMLAGHTKFSPDRHFGNFKSLYRKTFVSSLPDLAEVIILKYLGSTHMHMNKRSLDDLVEFP